MWKFTRPGSALCTLIVNTSFVSLVFPPIHKVAFALEPLTQGREARRSIWRSRSLSSAFLALAELATVLASSCLLCRFSRSYVHTRLHFCTHFANSMLLSTQSA